MTTLLVKLKQALSKTADKISKGIDNIVFKKKLDEETLTALEELLITADISHFIVVDLLNNLRSQKFNREVTPQVIKEKLKKSIVKILDTANQPFKLTANELNIVLICGVNGNGKTTTIGKLAIMYSLAGKKVAVAACDTFRAAAVQQLAHFASQATITLFKGMQGADPASVAYTAITQAIATRVDLLLIDTAGRLHNYQNLMDELAKIVKTIKKLVPSAPQHSILVIDATTGQNAYNQVQQFTQSANITGLIVTKLDGTAKAGVIIGIVKKFHLPIYFIGIGEQVGDLRNFDPKAFAQALVGLS